MKKIVLPTDFSDNAINAVEYAIAMFSDEDVEFILLNTYIEPYTSADTFVSISDILEKESKRKMEAEHERLSEKFPDVSKRISQYTQYGLLSEVVNSLSKKENIDLIVMGTKGASGLKKILVGTNTADVLKRVTHPTLVVPENANYTVPKNIALAFDYNEIHGEKSLDPLFEIARKNKSELFIVNVHQKNSLINPTQAAEGIILDGKLEAISHNFFDEENENIAEGIQQFIKNHAIQMLTVVARHHSFFERLFKNSMSNELTMYTTIPLLVLHENK